MKKTKANEKRTAKPGNKTSSLTPQRKLLKFPRSSKNSVSPHHANNSTDTSYTRHYKVTGKQTRTWKALDKDLKDYLCLLIDSTLKTVGCKQAYSKDEGVQDVLSQTQRRLKSALDKIKVPKKRYKNFKELKHTVTELQNEYENSTNQHLALEKAIRQEERMIEALEDGVEIEDLVLKVPGDVLTLPKMVFGTS